MPSTLPRHDRSVQYTSVEWKKGPWLLSCRCLGLITKGRYLTSYTFASHLRRTPEAWGGKHRLPRGERLSHLLLLPDPNPQLDINTEPDLNGKLAKCSPSRFAFPQTLLRHHHVCFKTSWKQRGMPLPRDIRRNQYILIFSSVKLSMTETVVWLGRV